VAILVKLLFVYTVLKFIFIIKQRWDIITMTLNKYFLTTFEKYFNFWGANHLASLVSSITE